MWSLHATLSIHLASGTVFLLLGFLVPQATEKRALVKKSINMISRVTTLLHKAVLASSKIPATKFTPMVLKDLCYFTSAPSVKSSWSAEAAAPGVTQPLMAICFSADQFESSSEKDSEL